MPYSIQNLENPIHTAIVGMGAMGKGLLYQTLITPNIVCNAIADIDLKKAISVAEEFKLPYRVVSSKPELDIALLDNVLAISQDGELLAQECPIDVLIESTSAISAGANYVISALARGCHAVLMNAEIDLVYGKIFKRIADANNVICTSCDGDQHGVIKRLTNDIELWGFEVVLCGNIKGYLDRGSNPTSIIPEADKRDLTYKMATAYTDGSKLAIEMALVANNLELSLIKPGMIGPRIEQVTLESLSTLYDFPAIQQHGGVVDYVLGAKPDGGVFVIGYCENSYQNKLLKYYKRGDGPFYLFYRPYHLCHVEAMQCIFEAVLDRKSLLDFQKPQADVYSYAKHALSAETLLDGLGGYHCYGNIDLINDELLPICLSEGCLLKKDIAKDQPIALSDVIPGEDLKTFIRFQQKYRGSR